MIRKDSNMILVKNDKAVPMVYGVPSYSAVINFGRIFLDTPSLTVTDILLRIIREKVQ